LGNINSIIFDLLLVLLSIFAFIDYVKDKKIYRLLTIIPFIFALFLNTSLANSINETVVNLFAGIVVITVFAIFYLLITGKNKK
jgi:hypothetical protein